MYNEQFNVSRSFEYSDIVGYEVKKFRIDVKLSDNTTISMFVTHNANHVRNTLYNNTPHITGR